jgi:hypothetical protein
MDDFSDQFEVATGGELRRRYGLTAENRPTIHLDPRKVPKELRHLLPLAEYWGVGDDLIRDDIVYKADPEARQALVAAVARHEDALSAWLTSPEALHLGPTPAYVAFTCMRMASDLAEVLARKSERDR